MKKFTVTTICLAVAAIICLFVFLPKSQGSTQNETKQNESKISLFNMQYCIYAPKDSTVLVDNEKVHYNSNLDCYEAIVKKGRHTLTVQHDGCDDQVIDINADESSNETKVNLSYTAEYISQGEKVAKELLSSIIKDCWSLDYNIDSYDFLTETDKKRIENTIDKNIMTIESNLSSRYSVSDISFDLVPLITEGDKTNLSFDSDGSIFYSFTLNYSYTYDFHSPSYSTSKEVTKTRTVYIVIAKSKGVWCIKNLYLDLTSGEY